MYSLSVRKSLICEHAANLSLSASQAVGWLHFHFLHTNILSTQSHWALQIMSGRKSHRICLPGFFFFFPCLSCFGNSQIKSKQYVGILLVKISHSFHKEAKGIGTDAWLVILQQTIQRTFVEHLNPLSKISFILWGYWLVANRFKFQTSDIPNFTIVLNWQMLQFLIRCRSLNCRD